MKRLGTREAIHHVIKHLDVNVRTSGAASFSEDAHPDRAGLYVLKVWSYNMCIGAFCWGYETAPSGCATRKLTHYTLNHDKRSITTSKHQTWLAGALALHQKDAIELVEGPDPTANVVALERAMECGWLKVRGTIPAERILTSVELELVPREEGT